MIHFNLNIDLFYDFELAKGFEVKAIAVIEYPIIHIKARTKEAIEEEYDQFDKFIVQTTYNHGRFSLKQFADLTGISEGVFDFRAEELSKQKYINYDSKYIEPNYSNQQLITDASFERNIEKTRSFLLDGVTHQPLKRYFYSDRKEFLITEAEKDSYDNKVFNPAIIFNPPSKNIQSSIVAVPIEERQQYNIPIGLKEIVDYDFVLMTYPIAIVLSKTNENGLSKRIVDANGFYSEEEAVLPWQERLEMDLKKIEIQVEEREINRNGSKTKRPPELINNWGKTSLSIEGRIFDISKDKLKYFIERVYGTRNINDRNIRIGNDDITILVDSNFFDSEGANKKKLLEACSRGRDYYRQLERTGVWLIFLSITASDDNIKRLVELHELLKKEAELSQLLEFYNCRYKSLRKDLVHIQRFDKVEELDIYLFLCSRDSNFELNYQKLLRE